MVQWVKNPTVVARVPVEPRVPYPTRGRWVKGFYVATSVQVAAEDWIQSLAWELPYTEGSTIKKKKKRKLKRSSSRCGAAETNPTSIHEDSGLIPGLTQ